MERTLFKVTMAEYVSYYTKLEIRDHVLYGDDECLGDAYMYKIETQWVDGDVEPHFDSAGYYVADRKQPTGYYPDDDVNALFDSQADEIEYMKIRDLDETFVHEEEPMDLTYLVVSTSNKLQETMIFPGDENGQITSYGEVGVVAERYGSVNWHDHMEAMRILHPDYKLVKAILDDRLPGARSLWKKDEPVY